MRHMLSRWLAPSLFRPGPVGMLLNPFYIDRAALWKNIEGMASHIKGGRLLDVGCGQKPYRSLFRVDEYVGLELDRANNRSKRRADYYYDGHAFPFAEKAFDTVVCSEVLEHVFNPDEFLGEIRRVLNEGGGLLLTVPFMWVEHEQPADYGRYSSFGIRHLLERHGFQILEQRKTASGVGALFQLLNCYVHKRVEHWSVWIRYLAFIGLTCPINMCCTLMAAILPRDQDLYLGNVVFARKGAIGK